LKEVGIGSWDLEEVGGLLVFAQGSCLLDWEWDYGMGIDEVRGGGGRGRARAFLSSSFISPLTRHSPLATRLGRAVGKRTRKHYLSKTKRTVTGLDRALQGSSSSSKVTLLHTMYVYVCMPRM
jgi:hypothetical protein